MIALASTSTSASSTLLPYDFERFQPGYLVIGRFAKGPRSYPRRSSNSKAAKVATFGEYDVYQVIR